MKIISGINEIISMYEYYIIDQWGVMHNGSQGYSDAIECVDYLKKNNKKLIIISNSSKRSKSSFDNLPNLGFKKKSFLDFITSGEMIWQTILKSLDIYGKNLKKCFHIFDQSKEDGIRFRDGLKNIEFVDNILKSDFILACTPFENSKPIDYAYLLNCALEKNIIMFCANPDFETIEKGNNKNIFCIGTIAELYKNMGGKVVIQGKPSQEIYDEVMKKHKVDKSKIIAIGDSLFHDISGAINFGIDSILITSGIHSNHFSKNLNWENTDLLKYNINPSYICSKFMI